MPKVIYVEWIDSMCQNHWRKESEVKEGKPTLVITVGILVHQDDEQIVVTHSRSLGTDEVISAVHIPKCAIKKKRFIKL